MTVWSKVRMWLWGLVAVALLALAAGTYGYFSRPSSTVATTPVQIGGSFRLADHTGRTVTDSEFKGRPFAVFFGFANCPEICPTTLFELSTMLDEIGPEGRKMSIVFVTVDPERDTPEVLAAYARAFEPRVTALTGSPDEIAAMAKTFRASYRKAPLKDSGEYTMEHTATVYLMDRNGRFVTTLDYHEPRETRLAKLRRVL